MKKSELAQSETCAVCGKEYRPTELVRVAGTLLCPLCKAEEESCGCSD